VQEVLGLESHINEIKYKQQSQLAMMWLHIVIHIHIYI
jgi:hypothetical protein